MSYFGQFKLGFIMGWIWEQFTASWENTLHVPKWYVLNLLMPEVRFDFSTRGTFIISRHEEKYERSHKYHHINCCNSSVMSPLQFLQASVYPTNYCKLRNLCYYKSEQGLLKTKESSTVLLILVDLWHLRQVLQSRTIILKWFISCNTKII